MSRKRRILALAGVVAMVALVLPATFASADPSDANTVRLHMVSGTDYFRYTNADGSVEKTQTLSAKSCVFRSSGDAIVSLFGTPPTPASASTVGLSSDQLGVKGSGEGSSGKCAQVNVPAQILTMKVDPAGVLARKSFDFAELDIEAKYNATINIALYNKGTQVDADLSAAGLDFTKNCATSGSDCGPDSADHDNFRIRIPTTGAVQFDELRLWATTSDSQGSVALEGGRDGTPALPTGLGATIGTTDSIFHVTPTVNVTVAKAADAASVSAGDAIGYLMTVTNTSATTAYGVALSDTLPADAGASWWIDDGTYASVTDNSCMIASGTLSCGPADLSAGASYTVHITSPTSSATIADSPVSNAATVSGSNFASATTASQSIDVLGPGLSVTKVADDGIDADSTASDAESVTAGATIGYTITVANAAGAGKATGVSLSDTLPTDAGTSWSIDDGTHASVTDNSCMIASGTLSCGPADLAAGASYTVHITSPTSSATIADSPVENTATVSSTNGGSGSDSASIGVWSGVLDCGDTKTASSEGLASVTVTRHNNTDDATGVNCVEKNYVLTTTMAPPPGGEVDTNLIAFDQEAVTGQEAAHYTMEIHWTYPQGDSSNPNPSTIGGRIFYIDAGSGPDEAQLCPVVGYDGDGNPISGMHPSGLPWCITGQSYTIDAHGNIALTQAWDGLGDPKMW